MSPDEALAFAGVVIVGTILVVVFLINQE